MRYRRQTSTVKRDREQNQIRRVRLMGPVAAVENRDRSFYATFCSGLKFRVLPLVIEYWFES